MDGKKLQRWCGRKKKERMPLRMQLLAELLCEHRVDSTKNIRSRSI